MTITPADIRTALALPPMDAPARRLPKDVLAQHGAANASDRKLIDASIERLDWWATLSPATIGVASGQDSERPVAAIQLLALTARQQPSQRLLTIIHRAIPVPIILMTALPDGAGVRISLGPMRRAERISDQMVIERLCVAPDVSHIQEPATRAFLSSLALPALPQTNLAALYGAMIERIEALTVARITGGDFRLCTDVSNASARREALDQFVSIESEWLAVRASARREKALAQQVILGNAARALQDRLGQIRHELGAI